MLAVLVGVLLVVVIRPPARWVTGALPPDVRCEAVSGSLWSGRCGRAWLTRAQAGPPVIVQVEWRAVPSRLLQGRLTVQVRLARGGSVLEAEVRRGWGVTEVHTLRGLARLEDQLLPVIAAGWRGAARFEGLQLTLRGHQLVTARGELRLLQIRREGPPAVDYGDLLLRWPAAAPAGAVAASVSDLGGPLQVQATLLLASTGAWQLEGSVAPRGALAAELAAQLALLGPPDANGRRSVAMAGQP